MKYMLILTGPEGGMEDASPEDMKAVSTGTFASSDPTLDAMLRPTSPALSASGGIKITMIASMPSSAAITRMARP